MIASLVSLSACDREERESRGRPLAEAAAGGPLVSTLRAGEPPHPRPDPRAAEYENNAYAVSQGQKLFQAMNCSGCHAHGGGGMGPALMDDQWRYGGNMEQIVATLDQGRPNGMLSWRGRLTAQQMWQLAAYVRSLSAQQRQDVLPGRADEPSNTEPQTLRSREEMHSSSPAGVQGTAQ
ncbi:c-type cytochrome [Sphingobium sp. SCG-1]|uniref:c-type cytochrome n=1 Tax=Sphingobium sp. SCG-1 TaxID=2072936 RepID=UPI00166FD168|nr:c-type cytochrome [Sphingobium sp. SCG-1]